MEAIVGESEGCSVEQPLTLVLVEEHDTIRLVCAQRFPRLPALHLLAAIDRVDAAVLFLRTALPDVVLFGPRTIQEHTLHAVRALRAAERPVIVWSPSLQAGDVERLVRVGATAVLLKEGNLATLPGLLRQALVEAAPAPRESAISLASQATVGGGRRDRRATT